MTPAERFVVGVDLGQSNDPTAISVIHQTVTGTGEVELTYHDHRNATAREKAASHFDVRHLERVPLGTSYPRIADDLVAMMQRAPLRGEADLVIDETGVGRAVADIFEERGLEPKRVAITAGNDVSHQGGNRWHVPKGLLISAVAAKLHTGELRFAEDIPDRVALEDELQNFQRQTTAAGRSTFNAREGKHDDLILSIAIGLWWLMRTDDPTPVVAPIRGLY